MKQFEINVEGVTPYMQHRMDDESLDAWEKRRGFIIERNDVSKEDYTRALYHSYLDESGNPYIPSEHFRNSFINAGTYVKSKVGNAKKSMKNIVAGMFIVTPEKIYLPKEFTIDKRSAVNRNVKARIIVIRPKWEKWNVTFNLLVDNDTITIETIKDIITNAGSYVGVGSFTPTHSGMFGRFILKNIKQI